MNKETLKPWILAGYELFALEGPKGLKVEVISKKVSKSKSSFYHHFADIEVFTEFLLKYHMERATEIAQRERACKNIDPELINLLIDVKQDLFFNRQLRVNRTIESFKTCFETSNELVGEAFIMLWATEIGLADNMNLAQLVLGLALENFYLQITEETLTYDWLSSYFKGIQQMVRGIRKID